MSARITVAQAKKLGLYSDKPLRPAAKKLKRLKDIANVLSGPQHKLWCKVKHKWPEAVSEYKGAVPGRKFRIDIAFPDCKLAVEVDGWQYHGRLLADFKRCRARQNLLALNGWVILRFTASEIYSDVDRVVEHINDALQMLRIKDV